MELKFMKQNSEKIKRKKEMSKELNILSANGASVGQISLDDSVF